VLAADFPETIVNSTEILMSSQYLQTDTASMEWSGLQQPARPDRPAQEACLSSTLPYGVAWCETQYTAPVQ
jgi:hypothetical protein